MNGSSNGTRSSSSGRTPHPPVPPLTRSRVASPGSLRPVIDDREFARLEARAILEQVRKGSQVGAQSQAPAERRRGRRVAVLERRKGPVWLYGQIVLCVVLFGYLGCSLVR